MSAQHTPGPWEARHASGRTWDVWAMSGRRVAFTMLRDGGDDLPTEANAHLIAAAPELLTFAKLVDHYAKKREGQNVTEGQWEMLVSQARAAIAKADAA